MGQKLLTEAEWRKLASRRQRTSPVCWGARCYDPYAAKFHPANNRILQRFLLLAALITGLILPFAVPYTPPETFAEQAVGPAVSQPAVRSVREISYSLPWRETINTTFHRSELSRGKMMLLDENHPLPDDAPFPNTASIARTANGTVPVRSLDIKTGWQTITALSDLFHHLRMQQADGLFVSHGAVTVVQQKQNHFDTMRDLMRLYSPETAAALTVQMLDMPGTGELLQEHAIEFALMENSAEEISPEETYQGQLLLRTAWRYGFVRTDRSHAWRFRYVGKAHAAAMTYLNVDLATYLEWLHLKQHLVVWEGTKPIYLILCVPLIGEYAAFNLPKDCTFEVSLDNTGYALAACTL